MSVNVGNRTPSKYEYINAYYRVDNDALELCRNIFGVDDDEEEIKKNLIYLQAMHRRVLDLDIDIGNYINTAANLNPEIHDEYMKRRTYQAVAISLCHALLALYQQAMKNLHIKGNKYTNEVRNLIYLIECLTKWQDQDENIYGPITG